MYNRLLVRDGLDRIIRPYNNKSIFFTIDNLERIRLICDYDPLDKKKKVCFRIKMKNEPKLIIINGHLDIYSDSIYKDIMDTIIDNLEILYNKGRIICSNHNLEMDIKREISLYLLDRCNFFYNCKQFIIDSMKFKVI